MTSQEKTWADKILGIDRRIIFWILMVILTIPIFIPLGWPIPTSAPVKLFNTTFNSMPQNAVVLAIFDATVSSYPEMGSGEIAVAKTLANFIKTRNIKVIMWNSYQPDNVPIQEFYINPVFKDAGLEYGKNWCYLGFLTGGPSAITRIAYGIRDLFSTDAYGTAVNDLPVMQGVNVAQDFWLVILFGDFYYYTPSDWIVKYHVGCIMGVEGWGIPDGWSYLKLNQCQGFLPSVRGAAEYEAISGFIGDSVAILNSITLALLFSFVLAAIGNVAMFASKSRRKP
jgi:hypothetical protein